eukprot:329901-Rhodomonas_salina.1
MRAPLSPSAPVTRCTEQAQAKGRKRRGASQRYHAGGVGHIVRHTGNRSTAACVSTRESVRQNHDGAVGQYPVQEPVSVQGFVRRTVENCTGHRCTGVCVDTGRYRTILFCT